jgi:hypothetical protein
VINPYQVVPAFIAEFFKDRPLVFELSRPVMGVKGMMVGDNKKYIRLGGILGSISPSRQTRERSRRYRAPKELPPGNSTRTLLQRSALILHSNTLSGLNLRPPQSSLTTKPLKTSP